MFPDNPFIAYRRPRNLRDFLVKAKLCPAYTDNNYKSKYNKEKHRPNSPHQADDHMRIQKSHLHDTVLQMQKTSPTHQQNTSDRRRDIQHKTDDAVPQHPNQKGHKLADVRMHVCLQLFRERLSVACVASVSVWFWSKERPRNGILGFGRARNETRAKK